MISVYMKNKTKRPHRKRLLKIIPILRFLINLIIFISKDLFDLYVYIIWFADGHDNT